MEINLLFLDFFKKVHSFFLIVAKLRQSRTFKVLSSRLNDFMKIFSTLGLSDVLAGRDQRSICIIGFSLGVFFEIHSLTYSYAHEITGSSWAFQPIMSKEDLTVYLLASTLRSQRSI